MGQVRRVLSGVNGCGRGQEFVSRLFTRTPFVECLIGAWCNLAFMRLLEYGSLVFCLMAFMPFLCSVIIRFLGTGDIRERQVETRKFPGPSSARASPR